MNNSLTEELINEKRIRFYNDKIQESSPKNRLSIIIKNEFFVVFNLA